MGGTVREFVIRVIVLPTLLCILGMAAFGGMAISQVLADSAVPVAKVALELKLFVMLEALPMAGSLSLLGIVQGRVFFVTSSDSGSKEDARC
jgi:BCCT family betaine/carnitine transporter